MVCSECRGPVVAFAVPDDLRTHVDEAAAVEVCSRCFALQPAGEPDADPDWTAFGEAFPDGEAAVPMALALAFMESLVLNRAALADLLERVERAGTDPLLVVDRLAVSGNVQPDYDLRRRRRQLDQLLER